MSTIYNAGTGILCEIREAIYSAETIETNSTQETPLSTDVFERNPVYNSVGEYVSLC